MNPARILVVDDNATNLKLISKVLAHEGHIILEATTGEQAQQMIQAYRLDLILMDVGLPGIDGLSLTRQLKADSKTKDVVIIIVTAFAMAADVQKAFEAGCDGCITKPIDVDALSELVLKHLMRASQEERKSDLNVLLIDDTQSGLKLAQYVLRSSRHTANAAKVAEETLKSIKQSKPQVILLDLVMSDGDGLSLVRLLKSDPETRDIPIIATTSHPERFPRSMMMAAGCEGYLIKPLDSNI